MRSTEVRHARQEERLRRIAPIRPFENALQALIGASSVDSHSRRVRDTLNAKVVEILDGFGGDLDRGAMVEALEQLKVDIAPSRLDSLVGALQQVVATNMSALLVAPTDQIREAISRASEEAVQYASNPNGSKPPTEAASRLAQLIEDYVSEGAENP